MNYFFVINMAYNTNIGICPDKALTRVCMSATSKNSLSVYYPLVAHSTKIMTTKQPAFVNMYCVSFFFAALGTKRGAQ